MSVKNAKLTKLLKKIGMSEDDLVEQDKDYTQK